MAHPTRLKAAVFLVLAWALAACGSGSGGATSGGGNTNTTPPQIQNVTLTLDFAIDGLHAPFFVAQSKGYYHDAGLNVQIEPGQGSAQSVQVTGAGRAQFGVADAGTVAKGISQGVGIKAVAVLLQQTPAVTIALKTSSISTPGDLAGKSLGDAQQASTGVLLPAFLQANNVNPSSVHFVGMTFPARVPALLSGQVDAIGGYLQEFVNIQNKVNFIDWYKNGINAYGSTIIVNSTFLQTNGATVKAFVQASMKGLDYTIKHPNEAAAIVAQAAHGDVSYFTGELALLQPLFTGPDVTAHGYGWMSDARWNATQELNVKYAGQQQTVAPATVYTDEFLG